MKRLIVCLSLISLQYLSAAQDCKVLVDSLMGKYEGECNDGLANGEGSAIGIDTFRGHFKNGYPNGNGKYIWKNGNWYNGQWKHGKFNGQGTFHKTINIQKGGENDISGYWKDGEYKGKYEKPYIIHSATNGIVEVVVSKAKTNGEPIITLSVKCITAGALSIGTLSDERVMSKAKLTNLLVQKGRMERHRTDESSSTMTNWYEFRRIDYPVYSTLSFDSEQLQIELLENVSWDISINIQRSTNAQDYNVPASPRNQ